ncbi:hypothetical protein G6L00_16630 [Agrobacterium rhizogenes]|nr:hypothetical protein [Rhizobium rhizogenes]
MGEAKYRRQNNPFYGREPKVGRGIIISPPIVEEGSSTHIKIAAIDPQELRFYLLFFDRLLWPDNRLIHIESGNDEIFLEGCGILKRPMHHMTQGNSGDIFGRIHLDTFVQKEREEPGLWSLAGGENSLILKDASFKATGGSFLNLLSAVPVPDKAVPIEEILDFREKRRSELLSLRLQISEMARDVEKAGDDAAVFVCALERIEKACIDLLSVTREAKRPFRFANLKPSFKLDIVKILGNALHAGGVLAATGMPSLAAAAFSAGLDKDSVSVTFGGDLTMASKGATDNPFRYVTSYHSDLFGV